MDALSIRPLAGEPAIIARLAEILAATVAAGEPLVGAALRGQAVEWLDRRFGPHPALSGGELTPRIADNRRA